MFPVGNGLKEDALSQLLFNFALEYAIRMVQVNQDGFKCNATNQLLVYAYGVNILGRREYTIKRNIEALLIGSKKTGPAVNADKTNYMVMSRDQNAGRLHDIKTDNSSFEGGKSSNNWEQH